MGEETSDKSEYRVSPHMALLLARAPDMPRARGGGGGGGAVQVLQELKVMAPSHMTMSVEGK